MYFPKRILEPKLMDRLELNAFQKATIENYNRWLFPLVDDALKSSSLKKGVVLDVGCGPGLLAKEIARRSKGLSVFGIDLSPYAIKLSNQNCKGVTNTKFKVSSVYNLPFPNDYFDLVICKDSLHHFDQPKNAIREMLRVTRKQGLVYIQDLRRDLPQYLLARAIPPETTFQKLQYYSARAAFTKLELKNLLQSLRLENFHVSTLRLTQDIKKRYIKHGINLEQLKEGLQARYVATIYK